ncbi:MAG: recombinase family protein [Anaerolineae bacterium]|nr:recombinase family protein [Anaerolineae bacterium]
MSDMLRFAIYTRISMEEQHELSLELQEQKCREAIADRDGVVIDVYSDTNKTGWSLARDGFRRMQQDASQGKFDAIMFWKFDRLARDHAHVTMIKLLLRNEYQLKLFCVEGFSQDEDNDPQHALMEQMLAVFYAFYSQNLSHDTKRGKRHRAMTGEFNGSIPPLGYILITQKEATADRPAGLYIDQPIADLVRLAFERYATGNYSDGEIANWLMSQSHIQQLRQNKRAIDKDFVREMLQNWHYTGRVSHSDTQYAGTLGERKKSSRGRREWFEGKHERIISDELMQQCLDIRQKFRQTRVNADTQYTYLIGDIIWCSRCRQNKPEQLDDKNYGKMGGTRIDAGVYYRCRCVERGYKKCGQTYIKADKLDQRVIGVLKNLSTYIAPEMRPIIENAIQNQLDEQVSFKRMQDIMQIIHQTNIQWEHGFINQEDYLKKRAILEQEYQKLPPIDKTSATNVIDNFQYFWDSCQNREQQKTLVSCMIKRILVYDDTVNCMILYGDYEIKP